MIYGEVGQETCKMLALVPLYKAMLRVLRGTSDPELEPRWHNHNPIMVVTHSRDVFSTINRSKAGVGPYLNHALHLW